MRLPRQAVRLTNDGSATVSILSAKGFEMPKDIEVGVVGDRYVEVLSGLSVGDQVITNVGDNNVGDSNVKAVQ